MKMIKELGVVYALHIFSKLIIQIIIVVNAIISVKIVVKIQITVLHVTKI